MFEFSVWQEIFSTIKRNKLRTFLTGFSISWGIFMLIILLGSGNGLKHAVTSNFADSDLNVVTLWAGKTSMPYDGLKQGRNLVFNEYDVKILENLPHVNKVCPNFYQTATICYQNETTQCHIESVFPESIVIEDIKMISGRFINDLDLKLKRKVIVLNENSIDLFFKNEDPINKIVAIDNINFQVVGVRKSGMQYTRSLMIPFTTAKLLYNFQQYWELSFTTKDITNRTEAQELEKTIRRKISQIHRFNPDDRSAVHIYDRMSRYEETQLIFGAISLFIWIIAIGTLIAGIVGVSNIMVITIKERTREFGIRKALGATPLSILKLILLESLMITLIFGYLGMIFGIMLTEGISNLLEISNSGSDFVMFTNPTVDIGTAFSATLLLVISGLIAGYIPARKAVKIKPIEAIRYE